MKQFLRYGLLGIMGMTGSLLHAQVVKKTDSSKVFGKDTVKLKEVVVKATRRIYTEQQVDRLVVNIHALPSNAGISAADVLNNTPGISIEDNGNISIRGKDQALVLIDDKPVYLSGKELLAYLQSLPSGTLDKIEILPNPPARYSAAGSGGIIIIRTRKNNNQGFNGFVSLNYAQGVFPKSNSSIAGNYRKGRLNIHGMASFNLQHQYYDVQRSREYLAPVAYTITQDIHELNKRSSWNMKWGLDWDLSKQTTLGAFVKVFTSPYRESGAYSNSFYSPQPDSTVFTDSYLTTQSRNTLSNLNLLHRFQRQGRTLNINIDYFTSSDQSNQTLKSQTRWADQSSHNINTLISSNPFQVNINSFSADYSSPISSTVKMDLGAQSIHSTRNSEGNYWREDAGGTHPDNNLINKFSFKENITAAYISLNGQGKKLSWLSGLRMEDTRVNTALFSLHYTDFFPTLFLQYKLDSAGKQQLNLSLGKRIGRPGYQDYNPSIFFFNRYTYTTGNSFLQPQYAHNAELTYIHHKWLTLGLVYSSTRNSISQAYEQVNDVLITTTINIDRLTSMGINLTTSLPVTRWWAMNIYQELVRQHYKGLLFTGKQMLDKALTGYRLTASQQFSISNRFSADLTVAGRTNILYGQTTIKSAWQVHAGMQYKLGDRSNLTVTFRDIFRGWVLKREMQVPNVRINAVNANDTRYMGVTWTYRLGGSNMSKERKSAIQAEAGRAGGGG